MNNSDMPAMPQSGTEGNSGDLTNSQDWGGSGLTKREHFAIELMAAARANAYMFERVDTCSLYLAIGAIQDADALLKELDK
mgnify:CR=1 FL=1